MVIDNVIDNDYLVQLINRCLAAAPNKKVIKNVMGNSCEETTIGRIIVAEKPFGFILSQKGDYFYSLVMKWGDDFQAVVNRHSLIQFIHGSELDLHLLGGALDELYDDHNKNIEQNRRNKPRSEFIRRLDDLKEKFGHLKFD